MVVVPSRAARFAGAASISVGILVLAGWLFGAPTLTSVLPGLIAMKANTAIAFILLGTALILPAGRARVVLGCAASALGAANLVEYAGVDLGIDQLVVREPEGAVRTTHLGRMAQGTALAFLLLGADAAALGTRFGTRWNAWITVPPLAITVVSLTGYAYGVTTLQGAAAYTPLALHTAAALALLAAGLLFTRPDVGLARLVRGDTPGAFVARWLLPAGIVLPLAVGWLGLVGQRAGHYAPEHGAAVVATALAGAGAALAIWAARRVDRAHSARLAAEAESRRYGHLLHAVTDGTTDAVFVKDALWRYVFINRAGAEFAGRAGSEILGQDDFAVFPAVTARSMREHDAIAMGAARTVTFEESFDRGGTLCTLLTTTGPLRDAEGRVAGVFGIARDITQRKQAEAALEGVNLRLAERSNQLEAVNRELEAFSFSVSHDLKTPLQSIGGFAELVLIQSAKQLDESGLANLRIICDQAHLMGGLIDDLLRLSQVARAELRRERVDLSDLAREVLDDLRRTNPARSVDVVVADGTVADGDAGLLRVVLVNLLGNAWKFTSRTERARIEFLLEANPEGSPSFAVRDNGAGFDMADAPRLFGAFQRLHAKSEFSGTGIGLATVRRIVERHGGRTWADGEVGRGATFWFTLAQPVASGSASASRAIRPIVPGSGNSDAALVSPRSCRA